MLGVVARLDSRPEVVDGGLRRCHESVLAEPRPHGCEQTEHDPGYRGVNAGAQQPLRVVRGRGRDGSVMVR